MALPSSGQLSINQINVELEKSGTTQGSLNDTDFRSLAGIASGAISIASFYGKSLWAYMTGALWTTRNTLAAWGFGVTVDTGVKSSPSNVKPITITLQLVGGQQDNSSQQMTRIITGYRKSDGVAVELFNTTSALGPTINQTDSVTLPGTVEYNRIVGSASGKLKMNTYLEVKITSWNQKN